MDKTNSITISTERKSGQYLGAEERGAIQHFKKLGYSNRAIAKAVNRSRCRRPKSLPRNSQFLRWMAEKFQNHGRSIDTCVGRAKPGKSFSDDPIPCTKSIYNMIWKVELSITLLALWNG